MAGVSLFERAAEHGDRPAIRTDEGDHSYAELLAASERVAHTLLQGRPDLDEGRVAFLIPPGFAYVATLWGVWRAGGMAVPMAVSHPARELDLLLEDAAPEVLVVHSDLADRVAGAAAVRGVPVLDIATVLGAPAAAPSSEHREPQLPALDDQRAAMMIYTSGTSGRPKGVVTTHANLRAQVTAMVSAWGWSRGDHILHVLPLHHVHGVVNVLTCPLWIGALCEILPRFDAEDVWRRLTGGDVTLFMAVPTIYGRLIAHWQGVSAQERAALTAGCSGLRLWVSGSAALPVSTLEQWERISGEVLLERYGMTEIGMALSNPLEGERVPGHVGTPLPGVEVRLVDEAGAPVQGGEQGEIQVRGASVFRGYWRRPEATAEAFDGQWFRTGDVAALEDGVFRILGRSNVDIIKCGGFKISALEIEEVLRTHPRIQDCAVVGIEDLEWGERVSVAVVLDTAGAGGESADPLTLEELRGWAKERLAPYKVPSELRVVAELPQNVMGKVQKPEVKLLFGVE